MPTNFQQTFLVLYPLNNWPFEVGWSINEEYTIAPIPSHAKQAINNEKYVFGQWDSEALTNTPWWLIRRFSCNPIEQEHYKDHYADLVRDVALAFQIIAPIGIDIDATFVLEESEDFASISKLKTGRQMSSSFWARFVVFGENNLDSLAQVTLGITDALHKNIIRIANPFRFLEHGLQSMEIHIRSLLWITGLDALLMAANSKKFELRLFNLLGRDAYVFPEAEFLGQPKYRISDLAGDLYEFRSEIAHGREISQKFREPVGFRNIENKLIEEYSENYQYREILSDAALHMLTKALRMVLTTDLKTIIGDEKSWRTTLDNPIKS